MLSVVSGQEALVSRSARSIIFPVIVLFFFWGCASLRSEEGRTTRTGGGIENVGGATVISGAALGDFSGSVLDALQGRVPGMKILPHLDQCPQISLRSHVSFQSVVNPQVYVDGTRTVDTCILNSLRTQDVESVEVYPMGVTKRPGYATHAHGLILVFMRGAGK